MVVWYKNPVFLSVAVGVLSSLITAATPYASGSILAGAFVTIGGLIVSYLKEEETASAVTSAASKVVATTALPTATNSVTITAANVNSLTNALGVSVADAPIGSTVVAQAGGWYQVTTPSGNIVKTKIDPTTAI